MTQKQLHYKNKAIALEKLSTDKLFAITINPLDIRDSKTYRCPDVRVIYDFQAKFQLFYDWIKRLKHCSLQLYPELSQTGRLHYHGYIRIKNIFNFVWQDLHILSDYVYEIDTCETNDNVYQMYIQKQMHTMQPIFMELDFDYPIIVNNTLLAGVVHTPATLFPPSLSYKDYDDIMRENEPTSEEIEEYL